MNEGFRQAADGVEIDVRLTSDKKIVCHHDKTALRTTGVDKKIAEMTLEEIKTLDCGSWFGKSWNQERVPELKDVLRVLPHKKEIFIEVKTNEEIVPFLLENIGREKVDMGRITIITFYPEVIRQIKKIDSCINCNLLIAFDYKEIEFEEIIDLLNSTGADGVGAQNHKKLNLDLIMTLKEMRKTIHVWTVNSAQEAEEYLKMGIDSITTNRPMYLRNNLEQFS